MTSMNKVLILCPLAITGGPEAMHQLAGTLRNKGVNAYIMYYGGPNQGRLVVNAGVIKGTHSTAEQTPECYRHYGALVTTDCELHESLWVVIPEVLQFNVQSLKPAQVALWWLSVDNALASRRFIKDPNALQQWIKSMSLHMTQSVYAAAWLNANGQHEHWMLTDFTDFEFTKSFPSQGGRTRQILYNPRKGIQLADQLMHQMADWKFVPLQNFTKLQVRALMQTSRYYIDFGHHPGKDRLPREAAASGCVVMTYRAGAAQFFEDVPIEPFYKFTKMDIEKGLLCETLRKVDEDYASHWNAQERYRARIRQEKSIFEAEALSIFYA